MRTPDGGVLSPFAWSPVLVVDDDEASALLALKLLLRAGLRSVETVTDARLVLDWVRDHDPDLVLLDLHMPYLDGFTVLNGLREHASSTELPVIVLTADDTLEASERALGLGANDFLRKPLKSTELTHRVRNLLDMRVAHRNLQRRQRWLEGAEQFSRELFSGDRRRSSMDAMARQAKALADADHVVVMERAPELHLDAGPERFQCHEVTQSGTSQGLRVELDEAACRELAEHATPMLITDAKGHDEVAVSTDEAVDVGPMMLLPVRGADATRGVVALMRDRGREPYSAADLEAAQQFVHRAGIALDLSDRRAERKRHSDFLEILVSQVAEYAIVRLDTEGRVASWNVGAQRLQGFDAAAAIGRDVALFFPDEVVTQGVPHELLDRARAEGQARHQGWGVREDGSRFWAEFSLTALHDEHETPVGFALVTRDMTESRRLEQARESIFASLSHDLRTPLNSIQGFVEMIPIVDDDRRGEFIERVQSNVERLTTLLESLLDHARLRAGAVPLSPRPVEPAAVAAATVRDLEPLVGAHEVVVHDSELTVLADPQALGRVLANLLVNAIRYSPDGTRIDVRFEEAGKDGRILVVDQGRGIAAGDLETIFDEFERGSLAEDDGGTGLGLASVRHLVTLQHGRVSIDSTPGTGTTVVVELPRP